MNFRFGLALMLIVIASAACRAQVGGNIGFDAEGGFDTVINPESKFRILAF